MIVNDGKLQFFSTYDDGLIPYDDRNAVGYIMPGRISEEGTISLWSFLLGIHSGGFFRDWLGDRFWLIVHVGGLTLLLVLLSGTYDWLYRGGYFRSHSKS